ncbi:MAG: hypothetical protein V4608_01935 [Bacteroidota bacterium]
MQVKKLTIVNRHYPPNVNITGENAWDLANYLIKEHKIDVSIVHIDRKYEGGGNKREPFGTVYPIKTIYEGNNKILRYLTGIMDGYNLIRKAARISNAPIIVMTSPPLLPMWASKILSKKNREWILWSMDLFPEGFAASNEISPDNFLYKYALKETYKNAPQKIIALGPKQKQTLDKKYNKSIEHVILPCGVFLDQNKIEATPEWKTEVNKIYLGYCGNCGNPHSADFIKEVIDSINPETQHLVLAVYGNKAQQVIVHAKNKPGITILPSVPRNELHHIDVHLVTLVNSWTHVAVPSKAISSICSGATILFCGNKESDNWFMLQDAGWLVEDNANLKLNVRQAVSSLNWEDIMIKKANAYKISTDLNGLIKQSYATIATWAK